MRQTGLIILDGPDACGKTTLGEKLVREFDGLYIHCEGKRFDDMFNYQTEELVKATKMCDKQLVVIDRLWPSEMCYANVFRKGTKFPHQGRLMDRVIRKHAGIYVFCLPLDPLSYFKRHEDNLDPDHPYDNVNLGKVCDQYKDLYNSMKHRPDVTKYRIEVEGKRLKTFVYELAYDLRQWQGRQYVPCLDSQYKGLVGHLSPAKYLMIGERVNVKNPLYRWPFYEHANCSSYLCKSLDQAGIDDCQLMFMNCMDDPYFVTHARELVLEHKLKPVALGKIALEMSKRIGLKVKELPHPQFMKRFHYNDNEFVKKLKSTLK